MMAECQCVSCADCGGSGNVSVESDGYPEFDLEGCGTCRGSGLVERCSFCEEREELDEAFEAERKERMARL